MLVARNLSLPSGATLDLQVAAGECLAVTGASGTGKSRLLRQLADLDPSDAEIELDGGSRATTTGPDWRRQVVYLQPESGWWADRVSENFIAGLPDPQHLARLNLDPGLLDNPVERLSSGERQRLAFLRLLPLKPRVLLMDEPTSALDRQNTAALEEMLRELMAKDRTAVVLTSHDEEQVTRLADQHLELPAKRVAGG